MITLIEKYNPLKSEETILIPYSGLESKTIYDLIPEHIRESDVVVQVVRNGIELDDKQLKEIYLKDGDKISFRVVPKDPVVTPILISIAVGLVLQLAISAIVGKPKKIRPDRLESSQYGFDTPQMTTKNGTPINLVFGKIKISGHLLQNRVERKILPDQTQDDKLFMLIGLGEGGEEGWNSIAGIYNDGYTDPDELDISSFSDQLFINNNQASLLQGIKVSIRFGRKHQSIIPNFNETALLITPTSSLLMDYDFSGFSHINFGYRFQFKMATINLNTLPSSEVIYNGTFEVDSIDLVFSIEYLYNLFNHTHPVGAGLYLTIDWRVSGTTTWANTETIHLAYGPIRVEKLVPHRIENLNSRKIDVRVRVERQYAPLTLAEADSYVVNYLIKQKLYGLVVAEDDDLKPIPTPDEVKTSFFTATASILGAYNATNPQIVELYYLVLLSLIGNELYGPIAKIKLTEITENINRGFAYPNKALLALSFIPTEQIHGGPPEVNVITESLRLRVYRDITNATNAAPIVITTSKAHGFINGDSATVLGVLGNTAANGTWVIANVTSTTFELVGTTGNGAYAASSDDFVYALKYTNNPAWVIFYLLSNARSGLGDIISVNDLFIQSFIDTEDYCDTSVSNGAGGTHVRATWNGVIDNVKEAYEWAFAVAQTVPISIFRAGGKYRVKPDQAGSPIMLFNAGNSKNFVCGYADPARKINYVESTYLNEADNYIEDIAVALDESVTETGKYVKESTELIGVTRRGQALRLGTYKVNFNKLLVRYATWEADVGAIRCEPNDVVEYASESVFWGHSTGLVSSSTTTIIILDHVVTLDSGKTYKIRLFRKDGTFEEFFTVNSPGTYGEITLSTTASSAFDKYTPYSIGETANIVKQFKVVDMQLQNDLTVKIFGLQYDPNVYLDTITTLDPFVSKPGFTPKEFPADVTNLTANEVLVTQIDGTIVSGIDVFFEVPVSSVFAYSDVWVGLKVNNSTVINWSAIPAVTQVKGGNAFISGPFFPGMIVYVAVTPVSIFGARRLPASVANIFVSITGKLTNPANVSTFRVTRHLDVLTFTWDGVPDEGLFGYEIRTGSNWQSAVIVATNIFSTRYQTTLFFADPTASVSQKFLIKAKDTSGNYSVTEAIVTVSVEPGFGIESFVSRDEDALGWPGTKTNVSVVTGELKLDSGQQNGIYETAVIDQGVLARSRVAVFMQSQQIDTSLTWANATFTWDSDTAKNRTWEGTIGQFNFFAIIQARYGNTADLSAVAYNNFVFEELTFRYAQFKLLLSTKDISFSGKITDFKMNLDAIEIFDSKKNVALNMATANPATVSFNTSAVFHNDSGGIPNYSLTITCQDLGNGERFKITSKTLTNFVIEFRNSSDVLLTSGTRTIDYVASGF